MKSIMKINFIIIFLFFCYASEAQKKIIGRYSSNANPFMKIDFYSDYSFIEYQERGAAVLEYPFSHIISYGTFQKMKQYYIITSSPEINLPDSNHDSINIKSFTIPDQDSLIIETDSPYEQLLKEDKYVQKIYLYFVDVKCEDDSLSQKYEESLKIENHKYYSNNRITFYKPKEVKIKEIIIGVYSKFNDDIFDYRRLVAYNFKCSISNPLTNFVKIDIPFFTYSYPYYIRYKDYHIRILNKKQILFNGDIYSNKKYWEKVGRKRMKKIRKNGL